MPACFCKVVFECILSTPLKFLRKSGLGFLFSKLTINLVAKYIKITLQKVTFFCG